MRTLQTCGTSLTDCRKAPLALLCSPCLSQQSLPCSLGACAPALAWARPYPFTVAWSPPTCELALAQYLPPLALSRNAATTLLFIRLTSRQRLRSIGGCRKICSYPHARITRADRGFLTLRAEPGSRDSCMRLQARLRQLSTCLLYTSDAADE